MVILTRYKCSKFRNFEGNVPSVLFSANAQQNSTYPIASCLHTWCFQDVSCHWRLICIVDRIDLMSSRVIGLCTKYLRRGSNIPFFFFLYLFVFHSNKKSNLASTINDIRNKSNLLSGQQISQLKLPWQQPWPATVTTEDSEYFSSGGFNLRPTFYEITVIADSLGRWDERTEARRDCEI